MLNIIKFTAAFSVMLVGMGISAQQAEAQSLWGALINLTEPTQQPPQSAIYVKNYTGKDVRFRIWSNHGEYNKWRPVRDQDGVLVYSNASHFGIEAAVWNRAQQRYVVKGYAEFPWGSHVWFCKVGPNEYIFLRW